MRLPFVLLMTALPATALAEPAFQCRGTEPNWTLEIHGDAATFSFGRDGEMRIPQQTIAEGRDWPRAFTLVSRNDTAIVILDQRTCNAEPYAAEVLTQRGDVPVLLSGCCRAME